MKAVRILLVAALVSAFGLSSMAAAQAPVTKTVPAPTKQLAAGHTPKTVSSKHTTKSASTKHKKHSKKHHKSHKTVAAKPAKH